MSESSQNVIIKLTASGMEFSAGHFPIFFATERENLHVHNFTVACLLQLTKRDFYNYALFKNTLIDICNTLDEVLLLLEHSPYLRIPQEKGYYLCNFNNSNFSFLEH